MTFVSDISAQADASTRSGNPREKEELPKTVKENLIKMEIERSKKEFDKMLDDGAQAVKITEELENSYLQNQQFTAEDKKKLDRLEKLFKKIRKELGGDDDNEVETPSSAMIAVKTLKETAVNLFDELKKISRHSISAIAIQSSNSLLKIVRFLRFGTN